MFRRINVLCWALALGLLAAPLLADGADGAAEPGVAGTVQRAPTPIRLGAATTSVTVGVGQTVQFQDQSTGPPTSWDWDFSYDGALAVTDSTLQNPIWSFDLGGIYTVRLEVCNLAGCSAATHDVTVAQCNATLDVVLPGLNPTPFDTTSTYEACHTITTTGVLEISQPGNVTFRAGRSIAFESGFSVGSGASFQAVIDPTLNTP